LKKISLLAQLCIAFATLLLVIQAWPAGQRLETLLTIGFGIVWILSVWRQLAWLDSVMLVLYTLVVVYGIFMDRPILTGFVVIVFTLTAWGISYLNRRLELTSNPGIRQQFISNHLRRSGALVAVAVALVATRYFIKAELNLGVAILVGALAIIGLSQLVSFLLKQKE
jgi:hypothetical protein